MAVEWPDEVDRIITGDITVAFGCVTPAGGTVVTAVAPIGLRDREAGTVGFTTSLGLGKKLERIRKNPQVALAYHSREHGLCEEPGFVLVQGRATFEAEPSPEYLEDVISPQAARYLGPPKRGKLFWDRWLQEYYQDRVPVTVDVERVTAWPDERCTGAARTWGSEPAPPPPPQAPPKNGTGPRTDTARAGRRLAALPDRLLGFVGSDGYPDLMPVDVLESGPEGIRLTSERPFPAGGRRAGLLGHSYRPRLIGLESRTHTGWLSVADGAAPAPDAQAGGSPVVRRRSEAAALYAPHTDSGFRAPANKTLLLLANGLVAKRGLRRARRAAQT